VARYEVQLAPHLATLQHDDTIIVPKPIYRIMVEIDGVRIEIARAGYEEDPLVYVEVRHGDLGQDEPTQTITVPASKRQ